MEFAKMINEYDLWYKPNKLTDGDKLALRTVFLNQGNFTAAHALANDKSNETANNTYVKYFTKKYVLINLIGLLIYVYTHTGGENRTFREQIRDDKSEDPAERIKAIKFLCKSQYEKVAVFIFDKLKKTDVLILEEYMKEDLTIDENEKFSFTKYKNWNSKFNKEEIKAIKSLLKGEGFRDDIDGVEYQTFYERKDVITEILRVFNLIRMNMNSRNMEVLREIRKDKGIRTRYRNDAMACLDDIQNFNNMLNQFVPKDIVKEEDKLIIDWGE